MILAQWRRFFGVGKVPAVIELLPEQVLGPEAKVACAQLGKNLGFQYLIQQLRRHKAALKSALEVCEEKDRVRLQEGIRWVGWLERFVEHEAKVQTVQKKEAGLTDQERQVLAQSLKNIDVIE